MHVDYIEENGLPYRIHNETGRSTISVPYSETQTADVVPSTTFDDLSCT
jgi:hypothetical protein